MKVNLKKQFSSKKIKMKVCQTLLLLFSINSIVAQDKIIEIRQAKEEFINVFRRTGVIDSHQSTLIIQKIQEYLNTSIGELHAQSLQIC